MNKFCQQCSETDQQQTSRVCRGDTIPFVRPDDLFVGYATAKGKEHAMSKMKPNFLTAQRK